MIALAAVVGLLLVAGFLWCASLCYGVLLIVLYVFTRYGMRFCGLLWFTFNCWLGCFVLFTWCLVVLRCLFVGVVVLRMLVSLIWLVCCLACAYGWVLGLFGYVDAGLEFVCWIVCVDMCSGYLRVVVFLVGLRWVFNSVVAILFTLCFVLAIVFCCCSVKLVCCFSALFVGVLVFWVFAC